MLGILSTSLFIFIGSALVFYFYPKTVLFVSAIVFYNFF